MKLKSRNEFLNESLDKIFGEVYQGDYNCEDKNLTSLVKLNVEKEINGDFNCAFNRLTNLLGSPQKVNGIFCCCDNDLVSLEGCPEITNEFDCADNPRLASLEFFPKEINGDLVIMGCPLITDEMIMNIRKKCKISGKILFK